MASLQQATGVEAHVPLQGWGRREPESARISLNPNVFTLMEKTLKGSYYGSTRPRIDMPRLLDMYMDGKLKIDELVSRTFTLEQVNEAYEALKEGGVARSVVKFF